MVGGGLPSPLPVREVRGEEIIVGEIHSVEILIALKLAVSLLFSW